MKAPAHIRLVRSGSDVNPPNAPQPEKSLRPGQIYAFRDVFGAGTTTFNYKLGSGAVVVVMLPASLAEAYARRTG